MLALENLALRQQLAMYRRTQPKPVIRWSDRLFWVGLASVDGSKPAIYRQGKTVIYRRPIETREFYCETGSGRKSVCTLVRQLRGPHLSTCA